MKHYQKTSLRVSSPSPAPRGLAARSRVLARLASLALIGELARRLSKNINDGNGYENVT